MTEPFRAIAAVVADVPVRAVAVECRVGELTVDGVRLAVLGGLPDLDRLCPAIHQGRERE